MAITKSFSKSLGGYSPEQIDDYLKKIDAEHTKYVKDCKISIAELEKKEILLGREIEDLEKLLSQQENTEDFILTLEKSIDSRIRFLEQIADGEKERIQKEYDLETQEILNKEKELKERIESCKKNFKFLISNIKRMSLEVGAAAVKKPELTLIENREYVKPRELNPEDYYSFVKEEPEEIKEEPKKNAVGQNIDPIELMYLQGKRAGADLFDSSGNLIVEEGQAFTEASIVRAMGAGVLDKLVKDMID